ncbi:S-adenosyl-L-methionine-dependent methyltransferase [Daldinia decipiens]|uniref:S-adenosyl-L-methionine-dependent methyltransferase n=1 Tax=Daldinia decipiens TaxID=326647 RepID=UPI0020C2E120|nr:S-adenosyl-L-methionine-dependent methyltransferase [Daldinia decipiens]KAI1661581.1 S-adenosyl-L-methionine-dependent methyltransferase [Daldinia decipiens]
MADSQPTLNSLAAKITELSETFTRYLKDNNIQQPTFAADSPTSYSSLSPEAFVTRQLLADALSDLWYLSQGPSESIYNYVHSCIPDASALNILNHFDFWSAVPLDGTASYPEIAQRVSLPEDVVRRVLRHAVTLRLFEETDPGKSSSNIRHTSRSAALARNAGLKALVSSVLDVASAPMMVMPEALRKYSRGKPALTQDMDETSFALLYSGGKLGNHKTSWDLLENDGEGENKGWRQRDFVSFMAYIKEIFHLEGVLLDAYDWKAVGKASVVDVGGSAGHDAFALAQKFPELTITVQDLPQVQTVFEANVPEDLKDRVSFVAHDFFQPQPVQADIYIIKLILHDWPDHEAVKMLRAMIPGLKPGARLVLIEYIGNQGETEEPALARSIQNMGTASDLRIMALFNARERPVDAWAKIFRDADERFELAHVNANPLTFISVVEFVWRG